MNDRSKLIDDSVARDVSRASCFGVLPRNRASTSCFGVVRRRLASESCVGVLLRNNSTRLRHAVTSHGVWGQTAKYVIDKHPGLCFATPLQSRIKMWLRMHTRLCFVSLHRSPLGPIGTLVDPQHDILIRDTLVSQRASVSATLPRLSLRILSLSR
jgi:hypothetical protein